MALPCCGARRVVAEPVGVGLNGVTVPKEEKTELIGRHACDESFSFIEDGAQALRDGTGVDRWFARDALKISCGIARIAPDSR